MKISILLFFRFIICKKKTDRILLILCIKLLLKFFKLNLYYLLNLLLGLSWKLTNDWHILKIIISSLLILVLSLKLVSSLQLFFKKIIICLILY